MGAAQVAYETMVQALRMGIKLPARDINRILQASGHGYQELCLAALVGQRSRCRRPGDKCRCGGFIIIRSSRRAGRVASQYLRCNRCGRSAGVRRVSTSLIRPRRKKAL